MGWNALCFAIPVLDGCRLLQYFSSQRFQRYQVMPTSSFEESVRLRIGNILLENQENPKVQGWLRRIPLHERSENQDLTAFLVQNSFHVVEEESLDVRIEEGGLLGKPRVYIVCGKWLSKEYCGLGVLRQLSYVLHNTSLISRVCQCITSLSVSVFSVCVAKLSLVVSVITVLFVKVVVKMGMNYVNVLKADRFVGMYAERSVLRSQIELLQCRKVLMEKSSFLKRHIVYKCYPQLQSRIQFFEDEIRRRVGLGIA